MKKFFTLMFVLIAWATSLTAQITREQADEIVLEYIQNEITVPYLLYIHQNSPVTDGIIITTETEEIVNIKYNSWFYYLTDFPEINTFRHRYLLVKETNGNLLEIIPQNDIDPNELHSNWECINFVAVSEIIDLPETAFAYIPLALSGTVIPDNAIFQTISWSIFDAGTTGAMLTDNILTTTDSGTAIITATIVDGTAFGVDYPQNFTLSVNKVALMGEISITGETIFNETLVAHHDLFSEPDISDLGDLTYQWQRGEENIGSNEDHYTIEQEDIGNNITVTISASHCDGMIISEQTAVVEKAPQTAPEAPTLSNFTTTSITLNTITGCEYRMDCGEWQTSNTFSELEPNTTYNFEARKTETETHLASPESESVPFSTQPLGIDDNLLGTVNIFPNPTTGELQVTSYGLQVTNIEVFDVYGRNVGAKFPSNKLEGWQPKADGVVFNISHLQSGLYFVRITTEEGIITKKIVKQ